MNLLELRVIHYQDKYNVYWGEKIILSAVKTEGFFYKSVGFYDVLQSSPFALYTEKRRLFGSNPKTMLLYTDKKKLNIAGKGELSSLQIGNVGYSLYNKLSGGEGFYLDNRQVGRYETVRSDSAGYDKKIIFTEEGFNYKLFVCLFISLDKN